MKRKTLLVLLACAMTLVFMVCTASAQEISGDNPIDRHFAIMFSDTYSTVEHRLMAATYWEAWKKELEHVAGANAKQELQALESKLKVVGETELAKWGGGTGGPGASLIAQGAVYKERALELIAKKGTKYQYAFHVVQREDQYVPLVIAMANSQIFHYDAFTSQPDSFTTNMTLYQMVINQKQFLGKDFLTPTDGAYNFRIASVDCNTDKAAAKTKDVCPAALYEDIFATGTYQLPDSNKFPAIVSTNTTGILISPVELSSSAALRFLAGWQQDNLLTLRFLLVKTSNSGDAKEWLGIADIILQKDAKATCGYKIMAYQPGYDTFIDDEDIVLAPKDDATLYVVQRMPKAKVTQQFPLGYHGALNAPKLINGLESLFGANLTVNSITETADSITIDWASSSSIFTGNNNIKKNLDITLLDYDSTVNILLDSVAKTLKANLKTKHIYYTTDNGKPLILPNYRVKQPLSSAGIAYEVK